MKSKFYVPPLTAYATTILGKSKDIIKVVAHLNFM